MEETFIKLDKFPDYKILDSNKLSSEIRYYAFWGKLEDCIKQYEAKFGKVPQDDIIIYNTKTCVCFFPMKGRR